MEGLLAAIIVAIITTVVQWKIAKKEREIRGGERKDKFRLAALDKRLNVHQEAYYRWSKMIRMRFKADSTDYLLDCQDWYHKNCLYLDSNSRVEFLRCINNVMDFKSSWKMWQEAEQQETKEKDGYSRVVKTMFNQILNTGDYLAKGIDLNYETVKDVKEKLQIDKD